MTGQSNACSEQAPLLHGSDEREVPMEAPRQVTSPSSGAAPMFAAAIFLIVAVFTCAIYANFSFVVTNKANLKYIPPFRPYANVNSNGHMGGEYYQMASALAAGEGFAHPFDRPTGPTAWQPPLLPLILAGFIWLFEGDRDCVMTAIVILQCLVLIGTGLLVVALVRQTARWMGATLASGAFLLFGLLYEFRNCFQFTHDCWFVLLALDLLVAGLCWGKPLKSWRRAAAWGLFGGWCAMTSPIVGLTWGLSTILVAIGERSWSRFGIVLLFAALAAAPWTIRNLVVFGRFIPGKSNLAFELYQSQCLQPDGLLLQFINHPFRTNNSEGREYRSLGEVGYLDRKWEQFLRSVWADPTDYLDRAASRFLAATVWYVPFGRGPNEGRTWVLWYDRVTYPIPFLALLFLIYSAFWRPLAPAQWAVIGVYTFYLTPYISASYYDRYGMPLFGIKVLFVLWAVDRLLTIAVNLFETHLLQKNRPWSPAGGTIEVESPAREAKVHA